MRPSVMGGPFSLFSLFLVFPPEVQKSSQPVVGLYAPQYGQVPHQNKYEPQFLQNMLLLHSQSEDLCSLRNLTSGREAFF